MGICGTGGLLKNGNKRINSGIKQVFDNGRSHSLAFSIKASHKTIISEENIREIYNLSPQVIGAGQFGSVRLGKLKINNKKSFAIKSISKKKYSDKENVNQLLNELEILKQCDHPNIIKFYETYQDQLFLHLVMEYCNGGQICQQLELYRTFNEDLVRNYMLNIFSSLVYIHSRGIVHRDIKLDNLVTIKNSNNILEIKVIDFGLSEIIAQEEDHMKRFAGSVIYVAPEVIDGDYVNKCDCWSTGVIMYQMLVGKLPFYDSDKDLLIKQIKSGKFDKTEQRWKELSSQAKDLIQKLLNINFEKRLSAEQAIAHPFFKKKVTEKHEKLQKIDKQIFENLKKSKQMPQIKRECWQILLRVVNEEQYNKYKDIFHTLDYNDDGELSKDDLYYSYQVQKIPITMGEIEEIINMIDPKETSSTNFVNEESQIGFTSFMSALISQDENIKSDKNLITFLCQYLDIDKNGKISQKNIEDCMARLGRVLPANEIKQLISQADFSNDEFISYVEMEFMMKYDSFQEMQQHYIEYIEIQNLQDQKNMQKSSSENIMNMDKLCNENITIDEKMDSIGEENISQCANLRYLKNQKN